MTRSKGIRLSPSARRIRAAEADRLYRSGLTAGGVAARLGVSRTTVQQDLALQGTLVRTRAERGLMKAGEDPMRRIVAQIRVDGTCWTWTGPRSSGGYAAIGTQDRKLTGHRYMYERLVGPIPAGLTLDHLCRNRACINPAHLEPVTHRENTLRGIGPTAINARKTHCTRGHMLEGDGVLVRSGSRRECLACRRIRDNARPPRRSRLVRA